MIEQRLFDAIDGHNRPAATHCTVNLTSIWAFEVAAAAVAIAAPFKVKHSNSIPSQWWEILINFQKLLVVKYLKYESHIQAVFF